MSSWKKIVFGIKNDVHLVKKELIVFSVIFFLLNSISQISSFALPNLAQNTPLLVAFLWGIALLCIALFINLYFFQKAYSEKKKAPVKIQGLWTTLLRIVQLYAIQMLILFGVIFGFVLILSLGLILFHATRTVALIVVCVIVGLATLFWIYRINFVTNIFMYERINWKSRVAIKESIQMIKTNASVILPLWCLPLLLSVPGIVENIQNPGINNPHILQNILVLVASYFSSVIGVYITVQAVIEHKYYFLLKPVEIANEL